MSVFERSPNYNNIAHRQEIAAPELGKKALDRLRKYFDISNDLPLIDALNLKGPRIIHVGKQKNFYLDTNPTPGQIAIPGQETTSATEPVVLEPDSY